MLTPPRSAEKLMRALSIDPLTSKNLPATALNNEIDYTYLAYLEQISDASYRDPPLPSAPPRQEPLFLDDDDDIQIGTDNRMVSVLEYQR